MENDENLYLYVTKELENDLLDEALWSKSYALSNGNEKQVKPKYMQLRVHSLKKILDEEDISYAEIFNINILELTRPFNMSSNIWMDNLWNWADEIGIKENILPRQKDSLLKLDTLIIDPLESDFFYEFDYVKYPIEISYLRSLKKSH